MKNSTPTVSAKWLEMAAIRLEIEAEESMITWILIGVAGRYSENLGKAAMLRKAQGIKSIALRREFLRSNGVAA